MTTSEVSALWAINDTLGDLVDAIDDLILAIKKTKDDE